MSLLWTFAPLLLSWCLPQALAKTYNLPKNVFIPPDIQYWAQNDVNTTIYDSQGLPWFCYTVRQTHCIPLFPLPSNFRTTRRPFKPGDHHGDHFYDEGDGSDNFLERPEVNYSNDTQGRTNVESNTIPGVASNSFEVDNSIIRTDNGTVILSNDTEAETTRARGRQLDDPSFYQNGTETTEDFTTETDDEANAITEPGIAFTTTLPVNQIQDDTEVSESSNESEMEATTEDHEEGTTNSNVLLDSTTKTGDDRQSTSETLSPDEMEDTTVINEDSFPAPATDEEESISGQNNENMNVEVDPDAMFSLTTTSAPGTMSTTLQRQQKSSLQPDPSSEGETFGITDAGSSYTSTLPSWSESYTDNISAMNDSDDSSAQTESSEESNAKESEPKTTDESTQSIVSHPIDKSPENRIFDGYTTRYEFSTQQSFGDEGTTADDATFSYGYTTVSSSDPSSSSTQNNGFNDDDKSSVESGTATSTSTNDGISAQPRFIPDFNNDSSTKIEEALPTDKFDKTRSTIPSSDSNESTTLGDVSTTFSSIFPTVTAEWQTIAPPELTTGSLDGESGTEEPSQATSTIPDYTTLPTDRELTYGDDDLGDRNSTRVPKNTSEAPVCKSCHLAEQFNGTATPIDDTTDEILLPGIGGFWDHTDIDNIVVVTTPTESDQVETTTVPMLPIDTTVTINEQETTTVLQPDSTATSILVANDDESTTTTPWVTSTSNPLVPGSVEATSTPVVDDSSITTMTLPNILIPDVVTELIKVQNDTRFNRKNETSKGRVEGGDEIQLLAPAYTVRGEACKDECLKRGYKYSWCTKATPSNIGNWYEYDYCSIESNITPYGEECIDACQKRGYSYFWCHKSTTLWGYCTPEHLVNKTKEWKGIFEQSVDQEVDVKGFTAYGEACYDSCQLRDGSAFTWCHKINESDRGTWPDRDFCTAKPGITSEGMACLDACELRGGFDYFWCNTQGGHGFCTPHHLLAAIPHESIDIVSTSEVVLDDTLAPRSINDDIEVESFGERPLTRAFTVFGEPCLNECARHGGSPYTWCTKSAQSSLGTWTDSDYCTSDPSVTPYNEECQDECEQRDQDYFWCHKKVTLWGFCTPKHLLDQLIPSQ